MTAMTRLGKRILQLREGVDRTKLYPVEQAVKMVKDRAKKRQCQCRAASILQSAKYLYALFQGGAGCRIVPLPAQDQAQVVEAVGGAAIEEGDLDEPAKLRKLAAWYRELAEQSGNPAIWDGRLRTAEDLEAEASHLETRSPQSED